MRHFARTRGSKSSVTLRPDNRKSHPLAPTMTRGNPAAPLALRPLPRHTPGSRGIRNGWPWRATDKAWRAQLPPNTISPDHPHSNRSYFQSTLPGAGTPSEFGLGLGRNHLQLGVSAPARCARSGLRAAFLAALQTRGLPGGRRVPAPCPRGLLAAAAMSRHAVTCQRGCGLHGGRQLCHRVPRAAWIGKGALRTFETPLAMQPSPLVHGSHLVRIAEILGIGLLGLVVPKVFEPPVADGPDTVVSLVHAVPRREDLQARSPLLSSDEMEIPASPREFRSRRWRARSGHRRRGPQAGRSPNPAQTSRASERLMAPVARKRKSSASPLAAPATVH